MRKPDFCLCENKGADQLRGDREADHAFVFATRIVQFLFLNPKFQASSLLLRLYSPVCVGPGRKSRRPVFSRRGSNCNYPHTLYRNCRIQAVILCRAFGHVVPNNSCFTTGSYMSFFLKRDFSKKYQGEPFTTFIKYILS